jgi:hypothetical protein
VVSIMEKGYALLQLLLKTILFLMWSIEEV